MGIFEKINENHNAVAVVTENEQITYQRLTEDADRLAAQIGKRCLVFLVCSNTYASLCGYVAFLRNNIVPLLIHHSMDHEMFQRLINTYQPQYIYQPKGFSQGNGIIDQNDYELIPMDTPIPTLHPELALLLTTSGSTGSPKFVKQTYQNISSNAQSIISYLQIESSDRAITTLPMSYTYGLSIINTHLLQGASIVITEATIMQKNFWDLLKQTKANNFGGVPYTYEMLKRIRFERMDLSSLRYITQAGGKLSEELHREFLQICKQRGFRFIIMYGQTEATARMSYLPWEYSMDKIGSIGIAIPGGRFILKDVGGEEISESNTVGELVYSGDNVTMGYALSREDLSVGDELHGILETGDMAYRDEDGYYYIVGRKKRFLKVYGNRLNLEEVDALLREGGFEAVTAGEDNHVIIYAVNGEAADIIRFISEKTRLNQQAFEVRHIAAIPRSESGKILYKELK
ncbi:MAG: AMP-binding protein [Lachnospiraceae bacterium]|nr:AMP-binding protein [Lachnospiraceae bacterium]